MTHKSEINVEIDDTPAYRKVEFFIETQKWRLSTYDGNGNGNSKVINWWFEEQSIPIDSNLWTTEQKTLFELTWG